jgi:hypothetical protein
MKLPSVEGDSGELSHICGRLLHSPDVDEPQCRSTISLFWMIQWEAEFQRQPSFLVRNYLSEGVLPTIHTLPEPPICYVFITSPVST